MKWIVLVIVALPTLAFAHPGHGETDPGTWRHYLTEPVHAVTLAVIAVAAVAISVAYRRRARV